MAVSLEHPLPLKHPFTCVISGPTGSGKTELVKNIILNIRETVDPVPDKIIWYYSAYQAELEYSLGGVVEFRQGLPSPTEFDGSENTLIIVDDSMGELNTDVRDFFTKGRHLKVSIVVLLQNYFFKGKAISDITKNAQYTILFKNPRDGMQVAYLARQAMPTDWRAMVQAYEMATSEPYGYLLIDMRQETPDQLRMRSKIIPGQSMEVYASKKVYKLGTMEVLRHYTRQRR